ncbi:MAG: hypothetical protein WAN65_08280 [Candidatus Sulfotelmatobacter sp.]
MGKKKGGTVATTEAVYRVQFFDANWNECEFLRREGPMPKMLLEIAMWVRSRENDQNDNDMIVFSIYYNVPFITVEEITHGKTEKRAYCRDEWAPSERGESPGSPDIAGSH